jgi:hypothetical protein
VQLRRNVNSFNDVNYNFILIDRLLNGHQLDGDYIRELPALKITGTLSAGQVMVGRDTTFDEGYDPDSISKQVSADIDSLKGSLGDMAYEDQVEIAKLGTTVVSGGFLQTIKINAALITAGTINVDRINARSIVAEKIAIGGITANELGTNSVTTIKIEQNAIIENRISNDAVTRYKIAAGSIYAGHITAGAITASKLASTLILGGVIYSGYGAGYLGALDQGIRFYTGTPPDSLVHRGAIRVFTTGLLSVASNGAVSIEASAGDVRLGPSSGNAVVPTLSNTYGLGKSTLYWSSVYAYRYYGKVTSIGAFDEYKDTDLVKNIQSKKEGNRLIIDPKSLPKEMVLGDEFVDLGSFSSLSIGALKELIQRIEVLENRMEGQKQ